MTNAQVFEAFASRKPAQGGSVHSEVNSAGDAILYSYATPIAFFGAGGDLPVFTERRFSVTTTKQQAQAKRIAGSWHEWTDENFRVMARQLGANFGFAR